MAILLLFCYLYRRLDNLLYMGEIYTDIKQNDENSADVEMWNNLMSVSYIIKGHNNIKFRDTEINRIYNIMCKTELKSVLHIML